MTSLSEQILNLCDPSPATVSPDWFEEHDESRAKICAYEEDDECLVDQGLGNKPSLRRDVFESDPRYAGKPVSRETLGTRWESCEEPESEEDYSEGKELGDLDFESEGEELDSSVRKGLNNDSVVDSGSEKEESGEILFEEEAMNKPDAESIDDLIISTNDQFAVNLKESVAEDVEKGKAIKNQISIWDGLLEGRIRLQKVLPLVNRLPQEEMMNVFKDQGKDLVTDKLKHSHSELTKLLNSLLQLQHQLFSQNTSTQHIISGPSSTGRDQSGACSGSDNEEIPSDFSDDGEAPDDCSDVDTPTSEQAPLVPPKMGKPSKKHKPCNQWSSSHEKYIQQIHEHFTPYRNDTITKWNEKFKLASGKMTSKAFLHFDRSVMAHIDYVLQDKQRLRKRTQLKRTCYKVLGQAATGEKKLALEENEKPSTAPLPIKDYDQEIFDDDDFYHQLLKELIDRKTSQSNTNDPIEMGRQWLELQKLRSKVKRKVDTKASKGRKLRYEVHQKLANFMAPEDRSSLSNSARNDLFSSLFGSRSSTSTTNTDC